MEQRDSDTVRETEAILDVSMLRLDTPGASNRIHFNNAGCGLMPSTVLAAVQSHLELEAEIGGYEASALRSEAVSGFYTEMARMLNCRPDNVAFASSATHAYATALSAIEFQAGDVILTTRNDFISNQIAFLSLRKRFGVEIIHAPDTAEGGVDVDSLAALARRLRPRLVAVTHVPTNSGLVQPVEAIGQVCRALGLTYLVDACQSVGELVVDVAAIGCDYLTGTCRKFLRGPRGTGFLYVSDRVLATPAEPLFIDMYGARWTSPGTYTPVTTAARFEDWEFPYASLLGCAEAVRYAAAVGIDSIARRTPALAQLLRTALDDIPGVQVLDKGSHLAGIVTFAITGWQAHPFKQQLDDRRINSALSFREFAQYDFGDKDVDWCLRLSPHYFNTAAEITEVAAAIATLAEGAG